MKIVFFSFLVFYFTLESLNFYNSEVTYNYSSNVDKEFDTINSNLLQTIKAYISSNDRFFLKEDSIYPYYNILFFEKDKQNYFMLFTWYMIPDNFEFIKTKNFYMYYIEKRKVIFFDNGNIANTLFCKCKENLKSARIDRKKNKTMGIYDGSLYPLTYEYKFQKDSVIIKKADSLFYESVVGNDFARFENLHITLPNGYRKNKTHD
jgi:hypothetical protein